MKDKGGRPKKPHYVKRLLIAKPLVDAALEVKAPEETFTALVEEGLDRVIKSRKRKRSKPDD